MRKTEKFAVTLTISVPGHKRDYHRVFEGFDTRSAARTFKASAEKETKRRQDEYDWSVDGINPEHTFVWKVADVWAPISREDHIKEIEFWTGPKEVGYE